MRSLIFLLFLAAGISAIWIIMPLLQGRDADFEGRLVGVLKVVEEKIEASSPEVVDADVFYSPSMEPAGRDNLWILTGIAAVKSPAGETTNRAYVAVVEASCRPYARRDCWRVEKLTLGERVLAIRESAAGGPGEMGGEVPVTPLEATSMPPSKAPRRAASRALSGQSKIVEASGAASEAAETDIAEAPSDGRSTNGDGQVKEFGQQQQSLAPPADPARDTSPSSTGTAWTQLDRTRVVLMQSRLKMLGFDLGLLDGIIGPRTVAAIEDYQRAQGLAVDGIPTRKLLAHLGQQSLVLGPRNEARSGTKVSQTSPVTAVHRTSSADTAAAHATPRNESLLFLTRSRLRQLGFDPGPLSGEFGPQARTAVKEYQRKNGLPVDGQPTWALLDHLEQVSLAQSRIGEGGTKIKDSGEPRARVDGYEHFKRAIAAAKKGAHDLAIEQNTRAIGAGNLSRELLAYAFNNRGHGYFLKGLSDRAKEDFGKAIQLSPYFSTAYHNRGIAYHKLGLYNRADADYSKAIQLKPDLSDIYFNRGGMYEAKGEQKSALRDFQKAYSLDPSNSIYQTKMKELGLLN